MAKKTLKTVTFKKKAPAKRKRSVLDGISTVKPATERDLEKEAARARTRIEEGSLEQDYTDFSALVASRGWQRLVFINQENARLLEKQILEKKNLNDETLEEADIDRLRDQRSAILEFIDLPTKTIARYKEAHDPEPEDDADPYETTAQAMAAQEGGAAP